MVQEILNDMIENEEKTAILDSSESSEIGTANISRTLTTPPPPPPLAMSSSSASSINKDLDLDTSVVQQQISPEDRSKSNNSNNPWFSLSNLSAAASAEFEHLQYNADCNGVDDENRAIISQKPTKSPTCAEDVSSSKKFKSNEVFSSYSSGFNNMYAEDKLSMSDDINLKFNVLDKKLASITSSSTASVIFINLNMIKSLLEALKLIKFCHNLRQSGIFFI